MQVLPRFVVSFFPFFIKLRIDVFGRHTQRSQSDLCKVLQYIQLVTDSFVVQTEQSVGCVCLSVWTITFELGNLRSRGLQ